MPVSSAHRTYEVSVDDVHRDDFEMLQSVWNVSDYELSHSRSPACVVGLSDTRHIRVFKIFDEEQKLVAYFPFEETQFCGVRIIRPAFYELTLDFIDISATPEWCNIAPSIFWTWVKNQRKTVADIFMCSERSLLAQAALTSGSISVERRGSYYYCDLPDDFEHYMQERGRWARRDARKTFRLFEEGIHFGIVDDSALGDEIEAIYQEFLRLHTIVFPQNSALVPHKDSLFRYIEKGIRAGIVVFVYARDMSTGDNVAIDILVRDHKRIGFLQAGRRVDSRYNKIGTWLLIHALKWSIEENINRFEFHFGDQEYKKHYSSGVDSAVSLTCFSSRWARCAFRIRQRLGRKISSLR